MSHFSRYALAAVCVLLTACAPKVSTEANVQTLRVGELEVTLSAPQWVTRQDFYPLKVTYTNKGQQKLTFSDAVNCSYLLVREAATGQVLKPDKQQTFVCTTEGIPPITLAPGESYSGVSRGIIDRYPKGRYVISPQDMQWLRPAQEAGPNPNKWIRPEFTPQPQKIFFEIR